MFDEPVPDSLLDPGGWRAPRERRMDRGRTCGDETEACVPGLTWLECMNHTRVSRFSMCWSSMMGSCVSTSVTWLTWRGCFLEWRDLHYLSWLGLFDLSHLTGSALLMCFLLRSTWTHGRCYETMVLFTRVHPVDRRISFSWLPHVSDLGPADLCGFPRRLG